jgi:hypothetical protein
MEVVVPPPGKMPHGLARCQLMYTVHTLEYLIYICFRCEVKLQLMIMFVTAKNEARRKFVKRNEANFCFRFASKRKIRSETKRKQAKKLVLDFRLNKRKQSETDYVSLHFALKRKNFLSETGAP